jgi:WD40 repeat protein
MFPLFRASSYPFAPTADKGRYSVAAALQGHEGPIMALSFHPDGTYLASGGQYSSYFTHTSH